MRRENRAAVPRHRHEGRRAPWSRCGSARRSREPGCPHGSDPPSVPSADRLGHSHECVSSSVGRVHRPADPSATPAHRPSAMARTRAIWTNRRILRILIVRDLKVRYSDSVLGFAWTLLDPLLLTLVYWFVFGVIVARGDTEEQPYILWLLTGILPFQWTAHVLGDSGRLLGNDAKLVDVVEPAARDLGVCARCRRVSSSSCSPCRSQRCSSCSSHVHRRRRRSRRRGCWILPVAFAVQFLFNIGLGLTLGPALHAVSGRAPAGAGLHHPVPLPVTGDLRSGVSRAARDPPDVAQLDARWQQRWPEWLPWSTR